MASLTVNVTYADIRSGTPNTRDKCAIACALKRRGYHRVSVRPSYENALVCLTNQRGDNKAYSLPWEGAHWARSYDRHPTESKPIKLKLTEK